MLGQGRFPGAVSPNTDNTALSSTFFFSSLLYLEAEDILSCPCPEEQRQLTGFLSHQGLDL